jgi:hypothetical protein
LGFDFTNFCFQYDRYTTAGKQSRRNTDELNLHKEGGKEREHPRREQEPEVKRNKDYYCCLS